MSARRMGARDECFPDDLKGIDWIVREPQGLVIEVQRKKMSYLRRLIATCRHRWRLFAEDDGP